MLAHSQPMGFWPSKNILSHPIPKPSASVERTMSHFLSPA